MKNFRKIIHPCICDTGRKEKSDGFVEIVYNSGNLKISGVIGPRSNGDCFGSCGQCVDEIRRGEPVDGWNREMLNKFCDIWDEYHLNDMRPYCNHMKSLGWKWNERIRVETWVLTRETLQRKRDAENRALECLKNGETFHPTKDETTYAKMPYSIKRYGDDPEPYANTRYRESYELREKDALGKPSVEYKTRGWISYKENHLGFIGRPCPICGYSYGSGWIKEEIPEEVITWLLSLPDSKKKPAWI